MVEYSLVSCNINYLDSHEVTGVTMNVQFYFIFNGNMTQTHCLMLAILNTFHYAIDPVQTFAFLSECLRLKNSVP